MTARAINDTTSRHSSAIAVVTRIFLADDTVER